MSCSDLKSRSLHRVPCTLLGGLLALLLADAASAQVADLCDGLVQDKIPRPLVEIPKPAKRAAYQDPAFHTTIRRITEVPLGGPDAVLKPMYATMQAWNADESLLILWQRGRGHLLFDGQNYGFIRELLGPDVPTKPTDIEQILWDPIEPDLLYFPTNYNAVPNLMVHRVSTNQTAVLQNFAGPPVNCPSGDWARLLSLGSDPQYMSYGPERIAGLQCGEKKFVYSISERRVLASGQANTPNAPIVAPSGQLIYFEGSVLGYDRTQPADRAFRYLRTLAMASTVEHSSVGRSASGHDTYNAVSFDDADNGTLVNFDLATGARQVIVGPLNGYQYSPATTHFSALATHNPGWVAVSVVGNPTVPGLLNQELLLANTDTRQVCRIGHHRSYAGEGQWGYWAEPHNVLSPSGTRVLFGSDWRNGPSVDTYVVELPSFTPNRPRPSVQGFFLIDQNSREELAPLHDGDTVHIATYAGRTLDIATRSVPGNLSMMYYRVNGAAHSIDTVGPYSLHGAGNYLFPERVSFALGMNTVAAVALGDDGAVDGDPLSVTFQIVNP